MVAEVLELLATDCAVVAKQRENILNRWKIGERE